MFQIINRKSKKFDGLTLIRVRPNNFNLILKPDYNSAKDKHLHCPSQSLGSHMDSKIVRAARQIVERNSADEQEDSGIEQLNERITKMEGMLKTIVDRLNDLVRKKHE